MLQISPNQLIIIKDTLRIIYLNFIRQIIKSLTYLFTIIIFIILLYKQNFKFNELKIHMFLFIWRFFKILCPIISASKIGYPQDPGFLNFNQFWVREIIMNKISYNIIKWRCRDFFSSCGHTFKIFVFDII